MLTREQKLHQIINYYIYKSNLINKQLNLNFFITLIIFFITTYLIVVKLDYNNIPDWVLVVSLALFNAFIINFYKTKRLKEINEKSFENMIKEDLNQSSEYLIKSSLNTVKKSIIYNRHINKNTPISFCLKNIENVLLKYIVKKQIEKQKKQEYNDNRSTI